MLPYIKSQVHKLGHNRSHKRVLDIHFGLKSALDCWSQLSRAKNAQYICVFHPLFATDCLYNIEQHHQPYISSELFGKYCTKELKVSSLILFRIRHTNCPTVTSAETKHLPAKNEKWCPNCMEGHNRACGWHLPCQGKEPKFHQAVSSTNTRVSRSQATMWIERWPSAFVALTNIQRNNPTLHYNNSMPLLPQTELQWVVQNIPAGLCSRTWPALYLLK